MEDNGRLTVIGAGPAGVGAAMAAARHGIDVTIYELAPRPGLKPCGWGIPDHRKKEIPIPRETVLKEIDGAVLYVDGKHAIDYTGRGGPLGVVVDKPRMLETLLEDAGVKVVFRAPVSIPFGDGPAVAAVGVSWYEGEKINAVQVHLKAPKADREKLEFYFDSHLIGYYWVFPMGDGIVKVGVGGFAGMSELATKLERFIKRDPRLSGAPRVKPLHGAPLAVGGIKPRIIGSTVFTGESVGGVYPLTGEGIRPSFLLGKTVGEALALGRDPVKALMSSDTTWKIQLQRRILEMVKSLRPMRRAEFLSRLDPEVLVRIGLGDFSRLGLTAMVLKSPGILAQVIKRFLTK